MATTQNYFPRKSESAPKIYAYEDKYDPNLKGILKVGYTTIGVQERVRQQYNIVRPGEPPLPFLNGDLYSNMNHTLWFLPNVASCFAMRNYSHQSLLQ